MATHLERRTINKPGAQIEPLAEAILRTLTYADLYDYAMTADEIHRYLIGCAATRAQVQVALEDRSRLDGQIARGREFFTLKGREVLRGLRDSRRNLSAKLWDHARRYARFMAHLPFVRMVAVTGALAVDNAPEGDDIDFLIITAPGHLWTARGLIVLMVRLARLWGVHLCPNFLITENALVYEDRNLYSAHEIAQATPLFGPLLFRRYWLVNRWVEDYLPNVQSCASIEPELTLGRVGTWLKVLGERLLSTPPGIRLEHWEQVRKVARLRSQVSVESDQNQFDADCCKGHFGGHARRALEEYERRWSRILDG
jgi:hypothetical protein